jgi:hypothetical protein
MTHASAATGPFYHGTRVDLAVGDLLTPGFTSNYADRKLSWIYFSGTLDAAIWGCELAKGDTRERIYIVEPTAEFEDDPNLTDKAPCSTCPRQVCARRSPATRPNPTARAIRCAWSAKSRGGSRIRPSGWRR